MMLIYAILIGLMAYCGIVEAGERLSMKEIGQKSQTDKVRDSTSIC